MALKPLLATAPLALQLAIYVALILAFSTVFFAGFERPILAARPYYSAGGGVAAATTVTPQREARRLRPSFLAVALGLAALGVGVLARNAFMADKPYAFYLLLVATAILVLALAETRRPTGDRRGRGSGARVPSVRARAALRRRSLPQLDRIAA